MSPTAATCSFNISTEASINLLLLYPASQKHFVGNESCVGRHNNPEQGYRCCGDADNVSELRDRQKDKVIHGKSRRNGMGSFSYAYLVTCLLTPEGAGMEGGGNSLKRQSLLIIYKFSFLPNLLCNKFNSNC